MSNHKVFATQRKAVLVGKNATVDAILSDISLREAGVLTPRGAAKGTELELRFELPAHGQFIDLAIQTEVTHRHNVEDQIYLKLEFQHLTAEQLKVIKAFLEYKQRLRDSGKKPDFFQ